MIRQALCALCALLSAASLAKAEPPPIFSRLGYTESKSQAVERGVLFIVDATAEWCGPCKMMDRDTWVNPKVEAWLKEHAVAVQVDVDEQRGLASELGIKAMPTIIAFKGEKEFDRVVGYQGPDELLTWLNDVKAGKSSLETARELVENSGRVNVQDRLDFARTLLRNNKFDEATEQYAWLWKNMLEHEPAMVGVRSSFMAGEMQRLAVQHPPAKAAFTALRDEAETRLREAPTWDDLSDWLDLNGIIGDDAATLAWVDRNKSTDEGLDTLRRFIHVLEPLLQRHARHADFGAIIEDPAEIVRQQYQQLRLIESMRGGGGPQQQAVLAEFRLNVRRQIGYTHACLLAAKRDDDAWKAVTTAIELDDTPEMRGALVRQAIDIKQARPEHRELLDKTRHADIIARLDAALKG